MARPFACPPFEVFESVFLTCKKGSVCKIIICSEGKGSQSLVSIAPLGINYFIIRTWMFHFVTAVLCGAFSTAYKIFKYSLSQKKNLCDPVVFDKAICLVSGSCFRIYLNNSYEDREHHYKVPRASYSSIFDRVCWTVLPGKAEYPLEQRRKL